jgi:hypothetical protein
MRFTNNSRAFDHSLTPLPRWGDATLIIARTIAASIHS